MPSITRPKMALLGMLVKACIAVGGELLFFVFAAAVADKQQQSDFPLSASH